MSFQLGRTYGDYEFIDIESSSPLGVAYKVRNRPFNRFELLRVLSWTEDDSPARSERFLREASVHARLIHPNVVTFYAGVILDGQFAIATELVEGTTLAQRLELGALPIEQAISYISQALSALTCAHQMGIAHRDIRPDNLIVTPEGIIKLSGFTFAKGVADMQVTQVGTPLGDVYYQSPEQVKGDVAPDPRTDLYSMGVVFYELLTGRKPFDSNSHFEVMLAHVSQPPIPPRDVNASIPPELEAVVLKAMAKEPAGRFPSSAAFLAALEAVTTRFEFEVAAPASDAVQLPFPTVPRVASATEAPQEEVPAPQPQASAEVVLPADLQGMRFGVREAVVLGLGIVIMVASVLLISHS